MEKTLVSADRTIPLPQNILVCAPDFFDVIDIKNDWMATQKKVNISLAQTQFKTFVECLSREGMKVHFLPPQKNLEDMVFCANPGFAGFNSKGIPLWLESRMVYHSRQKEVAFHREFFKSKGFEICVPPKEIERFEGGGDLIWHPNYKLLWGGVGPRTQKEVYAWVRDQLEAPVVELNLKGSFYHLDTALCMLDNDTALIVPDAFERESLKKIHDLMPCVIETSSELAKIHMSTNAYKLPNGKILMPGDDVELHKTLRGLNYSLLSLDLSEFHKSGGSVFCLKQEIPLLP